MYDESNFLLQKFVDSIIDKIYLCKLKEYYLNRHAELVSTTVPNNFVRKKQDAANNCFLSYNKVVKTIK